MPAPAAGATIRAGLRVVFSSGKMRTACTSLSRAAVNAYMVNEIPPFHYATGCRYLLICLESNLNVSGMLWSPVTVSSLPCAP